MESRIFVTADLHYDHINIIKGQSKWNNLDACRDFKDVKEMNETIIESINTTVTSYDHLYLLGDLAFKNIYALVDLMTKIKCRNVHCVLGNHDQNIRDNRTFKMYNNTNETPFLATEFLGKTLLPNVEYSFRAQDLFLSVQQRVEITYKGIRFIMDHYPLSTWNQAMHGSIMLHGHVHGALDISDTNMFYKRLDVDWGKFQRPLSLDEVIEMMKNRKKLEY